MQHTLATSVAIVGGGPAGLALAGILERYGIDYMVYERSARKTPPRGGCLDLHYGSGQRALKEAGCFEEFKKHGRGGFATIAQIHDEHCNKVFAFGENRDSPEIDRSQLRKVLLTSIPEHKIKWSTKVESVDRDQHGKIVLNLGDGSCVSDHKLVVGADGLNSKVRHLVGFS